LARDTEEKRKEEAAKKSSWWSSCANSKFSFGIFAMSTDVLF
jgi:hypothetical protein